MKKRGTDRNLEKGQSLTEFAMSLVFLMILVAGVADFGRAFFSFVIIRDAAQEGAVYGAITEKSNIPDFKNRVEQRVKSAFIDPSDPGKVPINVDVLSVQTDIVGSACAGVGNSVRVTVDYSIPIATPFLGTILGSQEIPMSTSIEDTILYPLCP